jgi:hypothetical protein
MPVDVGRHPAKLYFRLQFSSRANVKRYLHEACASRTAKERVVRTRNECNDTVDRS